MRAWDETLALDVPQDPQGSARKMERRSVREWLEHVHTNTASLESRVLAAGIIALIRELERAPPGARRARGALSQLFADRFGGLDD